MRYIPSIITIGIDPIIIHTCYRPATILISKSAGYTITFIAIIEIGITEECILLSR